MHQKTFGSRNQCRKLSLMIWHTEMQRSSRTYYSRDVIELFVGYNRHHCIVINLKNCANCSFRTLYNLLSSTYYFSLIISLPLFKYLWNTILLYPFLAYTPSFLCSEILSSMYASWSPDLSCVRYRSEMTLLISTTSVPTIPLVSCQCSGEH